jgi:2-polyprenyl-6-methoxyphenol hydroxylase-like FAD-dependent oxidoreductase
MEHVRSWGLEEQVLAGGVEVDWLMWYCETVSRAAEGAGVEVGLPTRAQAALVSPVAPECVPQDHLESVLLAHLRSLGPARVELGTEVADLESRTDGVRVTLRAGRGETREVQARYLVAADGAYSSVRAALGIPMRGAADVLGGINALLRAPLWPMLGDHRYGIYAIQHPSAEGIFLPAGPNDRWRFGYLVDRATSGLRLPTPDEMSERIRLAAGIPDLPVRIEHVDSFSSAAQLAGRFRHEHAFLIGDAAHRVTPRGGTGMNTAIHDGYDLGWKLAWVLNGWASPALLDSYERERRPVAEHNVARSADPGGSLRDADEELRADLGGRIGHHWVTTPNGRVSTLDLLGPGLTLLTGPHDGGWHDAADAVLGGPPLALHAVDEITARALGIYKRGALLVRPDGIPAGWWSGHASPRPLVAGAIAEFGSSRPGSVAEVDHAVAEAAFVEQFEPQADTVGDGLSAASHHDGREEQLALVHEASLERVASEFGTAHREVTSG